MRRWIWLRLLPVPREERRSLPGGSCRHLGLATLRQTPTHLFDQGKPSSRSLGTGWRRVNRESGLFRALDKMRRVKPPRIVTFLSDYGLEDEFVGVCHGVMLKIAPDLKI